MNKQPVLFTSIVLLVVLGATSSGEVQNPRLDFRLENRTGINIHAIFISSHDADEWGEDVMEDDILRDGEDIDIEFHPRAGARLWDLRIEDKDGDSVEWEGIDPTKFEVLTLKIVKGKPIAEWR
ncbi:MAG: hypothetical protein EBU88_08080 [Acidobacteria bacterium]|nr:hypothetical protein [Acidobacteriota bacterium]